jgi:formamidopyrimidine-DNA glycosylase
VAEGDTVLLTATNLDKALRGQRLLKTDFRVPGFATVDLSGQTVLAVVARGKHLLLRTDGGFTVHTHLKMDGRWDISPPNAVRARMHHEVRAVLVTSRAVAVGRRLGITEVLPTSEEFRVVGHLGPDVLGPDWDRDEVVRRLVASPDREIGSALIDQRVMAGPGNVYRCEVCFLRGLDPCTPVGEVPDPGGVVDLMKRLMEANRTTGRQITTGNTRRGAERWVYGRAGQPCRRCGSSILRRESSPGERPVTYWCPACQPARPVVSRSGTT